MPSPSSSHSSRRSAAYSSALRSTRVSARQSVRSLSPSNSPKTVWVFPMSTARSIQSRFYRQSRRGPMGGVLLWLGVVPCVLPLLAAVCVGGCKKKSILDDPDERGKLSKIAARLDEGLGGK